MNYTNSLCNAINSLLHSNNIQRAFSVAFGKKILSLEKKGIKQKDRYNDDELGLFELVNKDRFSRLAKDKQEMAIGKLKELINTFSTETLDINFINNPHNFMSTATNDRAYISNLKIYNILSKPLIIKQNQIQEKLKTLNTGLTDLNRIQDFTYILEYIKPEMLTEDFLFNNKIFNIWHLLVFENTAIKPKDDKNKHDIQFFLDDNTYLLEERPANTEFYLIDKELLTFFLEELKEIDTNINKHLQEQIAQLQNHMGSYLARSCKVQGFLFREKELDELNEMSNTYSINF